MQTYLSEVIGKQYSYRVKLVAITRPMENGHWYSHDWFCHYVVHAVFEIESDRLENIKNRTTFSYRTIPGNENHMYVTNTLGEWIHFYRDYFDTDELAGAVYRILQDQFDFLKDDRYEMSPKHSD